MGKAKEHPASGKEKVKKQHQGKMQAGVTGHLLGQALSRTPGRTRRREFEHARELREHQVAKASVPVAPRPGTHGMEQQVVFLQKGGSRAVQRCLRFAAAGAQRRLVVPLRIFVDIREGCTCRWNTRIAECASNSNTTWERKRKGQGMKHQLSAGQPSCQVIASVAPHPAPESAGDGPA